ncbi:hypothetical protein [Poseidonibacter antarcticus]|uniref:hypothetical protein n=1 Tax=Poseidonibacter antarcticus TaxID=2478538 RepID=UPI000EF46719|nr:hypothetical protein [Poseidonibacter antarcticus]
MEDKKDNQIKIEAAKIDIKVSHIKDDNSKGFAPKVVVIGVGGGGCNALTHLAKNSNLKDVKMIATNTDLQHLDSIDNPKIEKIQLGKKLCRGLG